MTSELHALHIAAGLRQGRLITCGDRFAYSSEESADKAVSKKLHMEAYPCAFCRNWHIGGKLSEDKLRAIAFAPLSADELADMPTSLLLRDVIAHGCDRNDREELCDRCRGKYEEIDRRLSVRGKP